MSNQPAQPLPLTPEYLSEERRNAEQSIALNKGLPGAFVGKRTIELLDEIDRLGKELALAIAHDRQPYPTADAYEKVCSALEKSKQENQALRACLEEVKDAIWNGAEDTLWMPGNTNTTVVEFIEQALAHPRGGGES